METISRMRLLMALIGGLAGLCFYVVVQLHEAPTHNDRVVLLLGTLCASFFLAMLSTTGALHPQRALIGAACVGAGVTALMALASTGFASVQDMMSSSPAPILAAIVLAVIPLPFLIAADGRGWRDYPTLFTESWGIVVRMAAAWVFVGVVWAVIFLSDTLLSLVGVTIISDLIDHAPVVYVITGLTLGLGLAVVTEMADVVSPYLLLRLLRLILPVVLVVMGIFIIALPLRGLSGLFGNLSAAATLMAMTALAATLVTTAIDQTDAEATQSPFLTNATRALAVLLAVPALLAVYAIWLRVSDYGWTPGRVLAAVAAAIGLGYAAIYAVAALRRNQWRTVIRQGNIRMAIVLAIAAALMLTPLLSPERISAASQRSRLMNGATAQPGDLRDLADWGRAGQAAFAALETRAQEPGQQALAAAIADAKAYDVGQVVDPATIKADLVEIMPVVPRTATQRRDEVLDFLHLEDWQYRDWLNACQSRLANGAPGCVMVVADLLPAIAGDEVLVLLNRSGGYMWMQGYAGTGAALHETTITAADGAPLNYDDQLRMLQTLQIADPAPVPAPINQIVIEGRGLIVTP